MTARRAALLAAVGVLAALPAASEAAPARLSTGFVDMAALSGPDGAAWAGHMRAEGAARVRLAVSWAAIAPAAPPADAAGSAAWAGYAFAGLDAQVRAASAAGLEPFVSVSDAPRWAQAAARPSGVGAGAWKPDAEAFGRFMHAVAERYSGGFPDPLRPGATLPRVTAFQLWNEPNLDTYLAPQWEDGKPWAPERFRELVNAGAAQVKAVQPGATVVTAGLAPFGDYGTTSGKRLPPVRFLRSMLCLDEDLRRACKRTTRFDVLAHHPYAVRKPSSGARNAEDVTIPDLSRLTDVTEAARRAGTIRRTPRLWVTEVSYDSSPPDPDGVPDARRARWTSELLWRLWKAGTDTVIWWLVRDQAPTPSFAATYQSGMYLLDGTRKASAQAFRFPLVVTGRSSRKLRVWLRSPVAGRAQLQIRRGGRWRAAGSVSVRADGVRTVQVPRGGTTAVRAVVGGEASPAWSTR